MSTELEQVPEFANPVTGEVLTLAAPTEDLARFLADLRDLESRFREAKGIVTREITARLDRQAKWTLHLPGGLKIRGQSPAPVEEWDGLELRSALLELVDEGVVDIEAVDAAVETVVTYKPLKRGINSLRKLGGRVGAVVEAHRRESEPERRVSVSRGSG
jgi:hypothetical protein